MDSVLDYTGKDLAVADLTRERLTRLLAALQAFVGHDLLNQLVAIQGLARLLESSYAPLLDAEGRALLGRLAGLARETDLQARRLAEVGRLLREDAWGPPLALDEVIAEAVATVKVSGEFPSATFQVVLGGATVQTGRRLLHPVLVQLLRNAAAAVPDGEVRVVGQPVPGGAMVVIHDPGLGPVTQPAALTPLGMNEPAGFAGLGLLLVHQAVARWQGRLSLSTSKEGCDVALFLPDPPTEESAKERGGGT